MRGVIIAAIDSLRDRQPAGARVGNVDLVIVPFDGDVVVLHGRCHHRGALLADGTVEGDNLICGVHGWDYRFRTGVSEYNNAERLERFESWTEDGQLLVDADAVADFERRHPQPWRDDGDLGLYQDPHGAPEEPHVSVIQELAKHGLSRTGAHGPTAAMGVPRQQLPSWDDLQVLTAQLARLPELDDAPVETALVVGPNASRPLHLDIPLIVSDMSFGSLSREAKIALARGADRAGTGIASGEGGMLPEEQAECRRYFYEYASARFGFEWEKLARVQAFHFKGGQAAKTGTGGHLPGHKVTAEIAAVRGLPVGRSAISPSRFPDWSSLDQYRDFAVEVRKVTGGIPIGYKLSAQHIERDIDAALSIGVDYIILDGRGGATGAAPTLFRDNISVPTIPALARARAHLDRTAPDVTLFITGGLRTAADFVKALALGADGIAIANSAIQAIGCIGMRACHTNNCPVGIATQKDNLRARLKVEAAAARLASFLESSVKLMSVMARACGHRRLSDLCVDDLTTFKAEMADLSGVAFGGVGRR